jgi:uncharacterized protein YraI
MLNSRFFIYRWRQASMFMLLLASALALSCVDRSSTGTMSRSAFGSTPNSQPISSPSTQPTNPSKADAAVISTRANLREGPGMTYSSLLELEKGDALNLQGRRSGAWYNVIHIRSGKVGWIHGNSIKLLEPETITSTTQPKPEYPTPKPSSTPAVMPTALPETSSTRRPVLSDTAPSGVTAQCRDGTYSYSQHRQGTCSHHGGVAQWY